MDKAFTCPHCGAALYIPIGTGSTVCEYCRSQIIVDRAAMEREAAVQHEQAIYERSAEEYERATAEYEGSIKKWKKKVKKSIWVVFSLMVLFGIFWDHLNTGVGILTLMGAIVLSFVYPVKYAATKPVHPQEKAIPAKATAGLVLYMKYCGAFWAGGIISVIISSMIWVK